MAHSARRPIRLLAAAALTAGLALAHSSAASAHGGATIAQGQSKGVTVLVQGSPSTTPSGGPAADLATTRAGPGTGPDATLTYWVRPEGGKTFKVEAERDASGVRHAEISTAGRGDWESWDVSAVLKLSDGRTVRVSNDASNPPGPKPSPTAPAVAQANPVDEPVAVATTPAPVDDITGESDGAPGWVVPSVIALIVVALAGALISGRRHRDDDDAPEADDDWGSSSE